MSEMLGVIVKSDQFYTTVMDPLALGETTVYAQQGIEEAEAVIGFKDFYYEHCAMAVRKALEDQLHSGELALRKRSQRVQNPTLYQVKTMTEKNFSIHHRFEDQYGVYVLFDAEVTIGANTDGVYRSDVVTQWFIAYFTVQLSSQAVMVVLYEFSVYDPSVGLLKSTFDNYMLPILTKTDMEDAGERILREYWPDMMARPTTVDGMELARRMGLTVHDVRLSPDQSIMGMYVHETHEVEIVEENGEIKNTVFPAQSILIDFRCVRNRRQLSDNIIHECAHAYQHVHFMRLQAAYYQYIRPLGCKLVLDEGKGDFKNAPVQRMEWQARALTERIQMPRTMVVRMLSGMGIEKAATDTGRRQKELETAMRRLCTVFGVTRKKARRRLIDLGYEGASEISEWVDGRYVTAHNVFGKKYVPARVYAIGAKELTHLLCEDPRLKAILESGEFTYAEDHICVDHPKYVTYEKDGAKLTKYANEHPAECCLAFFVKRYNISKAYEPGAAYLQAVAVGKEYTFDTENAEDVRRIVEKLRAERLSRGRARRLPMDFSEALMTLSDEKGMRVPEVAYEAHIGETRLKQYRGGNLENINTRTVMCICKALCLDVEETKQMMGNAGVGFGESYEGDILRFIVEKMNGSTLEACNDFAVKAGIAPLYRDTSAQ